MRFTILFVLSGFSLFAQTDSYPAGLAPDRIILSLTESPATSMAVNWRTSREVAVSLVQVSLAMDSPDMEREARSIYGTMFLLQIRDSEAHYHSAIMDDLLPDTKYAYRVGDGNYWSEWNHFTTASKQHAKTSFLYFGDAQNEIKSLWSRAIRGAYTTLPDADFMLHAGDLVNRSNSDDEWGEWFYAGGWIYGMMPSLATPGNHEYVRDSTGHKVICRHWKPTFTLPENGPSSLLERAYYTDYQGIRFISVDTQVFMSDSIAASQQVMWLDDLLEHNTNRWTIVMMHHPVYSVRAGRNDLTIREALQPLFEQDGVDLVLQGHDHVYGRGTNLPIGLNARPTIDGPIYVVSVSGPKLHVSGLDDWMQRTGSNMQLYQVIEVEDDILKFKAYTVTGEIYDAFQLEKPLGGGPNIFLDEAPELKPEIVPIPTLHSAEYDSVRQVEYFNRFEDYIRRKKNRALLQKK